MLTNSLKAFGGYNIWYYLGLFLMRTRRRGTGTSPRVWTKVIKELDARAAEAVSRIRKSIDTVIPLIDKLLALGTKLDTYRVGDDGSIFNGLASLREIASKPAIGVDSSMSRPVRIGHTYYAVVDSALIHYSDAYTNEPTEEVYVDIAVAPDAAEPAYAKSEINLGMFEMENKALERAADLTSYGVTVFLDGPVIDPPTTPADPGLRFRYERYLAERAIHVKTILEKGGMIIGVVKRIHGSLIAKTLLEDIKSGTDGAKHAEELLRQRIGDYSLALYTALSLRHLGKPLTLILRPVRVTAAQVPAAKILEDQGVVVYTFLVIPLLPGVGSESRPLRVETALLQGEDAPNDVMRAAARAAAAIRAWLVPGTNLPRPVLMAHIRCTIRDRDSRRLLRELLSTSLHNAARQSMAASPDLLTAIL